MKYTGKLFGKVDRIYIPLILTSEEVDKLEREHAELITIANTINEFASGPMPWGGCKCDHGHDGRMPLQGPKCGRCLALERLREISSENAIGMAAGAAVPPLKSD